MAISAKDVAALRKATGLGMMESKQALVETGGDFDKAVDLLRQRGLAKMDSRSDRASAEGRVAAAVDGEHAALVEVLTETDFTANNESFVAMTQGVAEEALKQGVGEVSKSDAIQALVDEVRLTTKENVQFARGVVVGGPGKGVGSYVHFTGKIGVVVQLSGPASEELLKDLCMHISAASPAPLAVSEDDLPADLVAKEREIAKAQAIESGKPPEIAEKMVEGKIRKFFDEVVLPRQPFVKDDKKKIKDLLPDGVVIEAFYRFQVGG